MKKKIRNLVFIGLIVVTAVIGVRAIQLFMNKDSLPDTLLVLGGTALRERYAASMLRERTELKVLVSSGSDDPCLWLIFDKAHAPKERVWTEHCSANTVENFLYSVPILERWGSKKVILITDEPQADRALPMALLLLGAKGIWVRLELVPGSGGEPFRGSVLPYILLSALYAVTSQVYEPNCAKVTHLSEVDMHYWYKTGFECQQQAQVSDYRPALK